MAEGGSDPIIGAQVPASVDRRMLLMMCGAAALLARVSSAASSARRLTVVRGSTDVEGAVARLIEAVD